MAQKPYVIWSLGQKTLKCEFLEPWRNKIKAEGPFASNAPQGPEAQGRHRRHAAAATTEARHGGRLTRHKRIRTNIDSKSIEKGKKENKNNVTTTTTTRMMMMMMMMMMMTMI